VECPRQADHTLQNRQVIGVVEHVTDKAAVDLDGVDRQVLQVRQR
jgi:hypothetical protein